MDEQEFIAEVELANPKENTISNQGIAIREMKTKATCKVSTS